jgi:benzoate/toluate 1,2-dioxygenase alpha subunit
LFDSLNPNVVPLEDHLGITRVIIDQIVDQAPGGSGVLRGNWTYAFDRIWKLRMKNGAARAHVGSVPRNYAAARGHRG